MTDEAKFGNRDIADLLPWYETGRLGAADVLRVEAALATDPALRQELALVREEMTATVAVNEALGAPSRQAADRFFAQLDASPRGRRPFNPVRFIADRIEALGSRTVAWGALAVLVLVALQAGVILDLTRGSRDTTRYQSASVPDEAAQAGPALLVAFAPGAPADAIQKLLEDNALSITAGPSAGYFSVRVTRHDPAAGDLQAIMGKLSARRDVIRSVMLQSPPD